MQIRLDDTKQFRAFIETDIVPNVGDVLYICRNDVRTDEVEVTCRVFRVNDGILTKQIILYVKVLK